MTALAVLLVLTTTAVVAWAAHSLAGLPLAVAVALRALTHQRPAHVVGCHRLIGPVPNASAGLLVSWCGMRGLVTLSTALAVPP